MLVQATVEDIEKYGEFVYQIALDRSKSGYPTYTDGIKTKEEFLKSARDSVKQEESELLLYFSEDNMEGWLEYFWDEEDKYLQLYGCNINSGTKQALGELLSLLERRFHGYEWNFGFPKENKEAVEFFQESGFKVIEDSQDNVLFFESYELQEESNAVREITRENFEDFYVIHSKLEGKTYWTCDRILDDFDSWNIYVYYEKGIPVGTVYFQCFKEAMCIYGVDFADGIYRKDVFAALMVVALNKGKKIGTPYLTYFCESPEEQEVVCELGFQYVGPYVCYCREMEK